MRKLLSLGLIFCLPPVFADGEAYAASARAAALSPRLNIKTIRSMKKTINLDYHIYGGGFSIVSAKFTISLNKGSYKAASLIQPSGIGHLIAQGRFDSLVTGRITSRGLRPKSYTSDGDGPADHYRVRMKWNQAARHRVSASPGLPEYRVRAVKARLRAGMPDPLSSLLQTTMFEAKQPCRRRHRIFDGHTIWDLKYRYIKLDRLGKEGSGYYSGPAYKCRVKYKPIAGQSSRVLQLESQNPLPYVPVWFAPVQVDNTTLLVPVKIIFPTKWANGVVRLTGARIDGQPVSFTVKK